MGGGCWMNGWIYGHIYIYMLGERTRQKWRCHHPSCRIINLVRLSTRHRVKINV